jgi:hypothetical protein
MKTENNESECCKEKYNIKNHYCHHGGDSSAIYGLGVVGALFYFLKGATTFTLVMTGIGKAFFWPAFIIFRLLTDLHI